ncbi:unnamed protein product [Adineta ricciae]|uniref:Ionotropic glutamate receptor C-terminal domain-containing protein n=1 Tax=Adineta ricciae TaxID=249248 RepID=A0A814BZF4_ADIRI|nr:unnamed protein product [Adineta ricciae]
MIESCWLRIIFFQYLFGNVRTNWPSLNSSNIDLLGIFPYIANQSEPTQWSIQSHAMFKSAILLSHQYDIRIGGELVGYETIESKGDVVTAFGDTCEFVSNSTIIGIVGPSFSRESQYLGPLLGKIGIPFISYSSTDPQLSDRHTYSSFYRLVPSDSIAASAIADLFLQYEWTAGIIICQSDVFGSNGAKSISDEFTRRKLSITTTVQFDINTYEIKGDLTSILTFSSTRIILVWAEPFYINMILAEALERNLVGPQFLWILSTPISLNYFNKTFNENLNGIFVIESVTGNVVNAPTNDTLLKSAYEIWQRYEPETFPGSQNVNYFALFAFDATWTLIKMYEKFCSNVSSSCIEFLNNASCFDQHLQNSDSMLNLMNNMNYLGVSGLIEFNENTADRVTGIYYIIKNLQLSSNVLNYVPILVWSHATNWNFYSPTSVIIWPGNSLIAPSGSASLQNVHLRLVVTETAPFTMSSQFFNEFQQSNTKLVGYIPDLIELLRVQLGFIPEITLIANKTFNEIIDLVANDAYDLFLAQTTITAARSEKVSFSNSIYDNSLRILIRKELKTDIDLLTYLRSFSIQLWLAVLCACIYASLLLCVLERRENDALRHRSIISLIAMSIWFSFGTLVGYGVDFHVVTAAGRVLTVGLYLLSIVLVAAYTANLASELTISKSQDIIDGLDDIKNGKLSYSRIGILVGSSLEDYYLREISGGNKNFYPLKTKQEIYDGLLNNVIDASIVDGSVSEYIVNNIYCNLTLVGKDFNTNAFGIVFQKNWQYKNIFDKAVLLLRESGDIDELKRKWFKTTVCSETVQTTSQAMTIESMAGLFVTFIIISLLAIIVCLWKHRSCLNLAYVKKFFLKRNMYKEKHSTEIFRTNPTTVEKSLF